MKKRQTNKRLNQRYSKNPVIARSEWNERRSNPFMRLLRFARNDSSINKVVLFLFILFLPTQFGKHFFFDFSYLSGVRVDYLAPTIYLTDLLFLGLLILNFKTIWFFFVNKKMFFLFLILLVLSFFSISKPLFAYEVFKLFEMLTIFAVFKKKILSSKYLLIVFLTGCIFEFILALSQFIYKHSLQGVFYYFGERYLNLSTPNIAKASISGVEILRPYATFSHPNSLAGFYLLLHIFFLTDKKIKSLFLKNVFLFLTSLLILISFSKVAIVAFLLINFVYFFRLQTKKCWFCLVSKLAVFSVVAWVFLFIKTDPFTVLKRLELLKNSFTIIFQHPLFGVGLGNYLLAQNNFSSKYLTLINQPVHNIFLLYFAEFGILGGSLVILLLIKPLIGLIKKYPYVFLVVGITGFFDHYWFTLQQNILLLGVILGSL